jgi:DNA-binding response OmpR family regulator
MSAEVASDRLLEGEDPDTSFARDARHWIAVYREMISFKTDLLARVRTQLRKLPAAGRRDVSDNEVALIEGQLERYQRRLAYWYARHWQLEGMYVDDETRTITYRDRTVMLTRREFQLLSALVSRSPNYLTAQRLLVQAWHDGGLPEETLRTYIVRLRAKLAQLQVAARIANRPRRGYALVFEEQPGPTA